MTASRRFLYEVTNRPQYSGVILAYLWSINTTETEGSILTIYACGLKHMSQVH